MSYSLYVCNHVRTSLRNGFRIEFISEPEKHRFLIIAVKERIKNDALQISAGIDTDT